MRLPQRPPDIDKLMRSTTDLVELAQAFGGGRAVDGKRRYLHWDDMRSRQPPDGMSREMWWLSTVLARRGIAQDLPLLDVDGRPFRFSNVDVVQELVHKIDQQGA